MSNMHYIGTIKDNVVNKPIQIGGIEEQCLEEILKHCGIDVYDDFNWFNTDKWNLLFYKTTKENRNILPNLFIDDDYYKDEINYNEFPIVCNGEMLKSGDSYHMSGEKINMPEYKNFRKIDLTIELVNDILQNYSGWVTNRSEWFFNEIKNDYNTIAKWIEDNEIIYWWKYI